MSEKQATIYDVAEAAGVSIATVSRVMSGGSVSAASRKKVEEAMEALSYTPSPSASHKQEKKSQSRLALVVSELTNPYFAALAAGAEKEARRNGYTLQMYTVPLRSGNARPVIDRLIEQKLEGAVLVGGVVESGDQQVLDDLLRLEKIMPLVTIGPRIEGLSSINIASDLSVSVRKSLTHHCNSFVNRLPASFHVVVLLAVFFNLTHLFRIVVAEQLVDGDSKNICNLG